MRKINNPYDKIDEHYCFACSKKNPIGLKLDFFEDGDEVISKWIPQKEYTGFHNVIHGGIQAVLLDEIAAWCVQIKHKTSGVTSKMQTRFVKPVYIDKGEITLRSKISSITKNLVTIEVKLFDSENVLCSESEVQYFTFPQSIAKEKLHYPEYNSFLKKTKTQMCHHQFRQNLRERSLLLHQ